MRKLTIILGSVLAGLAVLGAALYYFIDAQQFRGPLQEQLTQRLHRQVELGPIGLSIFPLALRLDGVTIGDDPRFSRTTPFLKARQMYVSASLTALLQKRVEISSLRLTEPSVSLICDKNGQWNATTMGSSSSSSGESTPFRLNELRIDQGSVSITDLRSDPRPSVYAPIDVTLRDYAPGSRYQFEASLALPKPAGGTVAISGAGTPENGPSEGKISLRAAPLSALRRLAGSPAATSTDYTLDGDINALPRENALVASGQMSVRPGGQFQFEGRYHRAEGLLEIQKLEAALAHSHLRASGQVYLNETPARLALNLATEDAVIPDLQQLAAAFGSGWEGETTGTLRFNARVEGPASAPALRGQASVGELTYKSASGMVRAKPVKLDDLVASLAASGLRATAVIDIGELAYDQLVLSQVRANTRMENGVLRLDPLQASLYGGSSTGALSLDTRSGRSNISLHSKLSGVDANQLLASTTSLKQTLFGKLAADADIEASPKPGQDFARALRGTLNLNLTDGRIAGIQIMNELAGLARFAGFKPSDKPFTNFVALTGGFQLNDGQAQTDNLRLDFDGGSLSAAGIVGLVDQTIQLRLTSTLGKSFAQQFPGTQAAGWMNTFLSNPRGEFVIPARVTGTFAKPKFSPDPERMAKMKLEGFLPTKGATPQSVTDSVKGVMDLFRKKPAPAEKK